MSGANSIDRDTRKVNKHLKEGRKVVLARESKTTAAIVHAIKEDVDEDLFANLDMDRLIAGIALITQVNPICKVCGKLGHGQNSNKMYQCQGCFMIYYCSKECQKSDWKNHKKLCDRHDKK